MKKLDAAALVTFLREFPEWREGGDAIRRMFQFQDFNQAFAFMTRVALLAEKLDHHPEWLNVYGNIDVTLSTHDAGGVTAKDIEMAKAMEEYARG